MRLVLVSPAWRRYSVTRVALAQRRHLCDELAGRGLEATCLVVADDDNLDIAADHGFPTLEAPNEPLGSKFNDGIEHAVRALDADVVAAVGSDDWVHPDLFDRLPDPSPEPPMLTASTSVVSWTPGAPEVITGKKLAVVDTHTGRLTRCTITGRNGTIPWLIPREALKKSGFRPVNERQQRGIDFSLMLGLGVQPSLVFHDPHSLCRVDFKSDVNLNGYRQTVGVLGDGPDEDACEALAEAYPAHLVDMARGLQAVAA